MPTATLSETKPIQAGMSGPHGYGFSLRGEHGRPLVRIIFDSPAAANGAAVQLRDVLAKARHGPQWLTQRAAN